MDPRRPHLRIPFEVADGRVAVVEQDTSRDVEQAVLACLSTPIGSRDDDPEYGVDLQLFHRTPIDMTPVLAAVEACEPRASLISESRFAELVESVVVKVRTAAA